MDLESDSPFMSKMAFVAYRKLREIADKYKLEIDPPRIVFVGETSAGKSMLVQNFLGFPCTFSQSGVATRCPVAYQLHYKEDATEHRVIKPSGVHTNMLAARLHDHMKGIEQGPKFSTDAYQIELESNAYPDLEILDVPGLICGSDNSEDRNAVEKITEFYVRDPNFVIVLLIEANQDLANCYGARTIDDLCTGKVNKGSGKPPRLDYKNSMLTIQTKFDLFMNNHANGAHANKDIQDRLDTFRETYFVSMIYDARVMTDEGFESNVQYMRDLPQRESDLVDQWIIEKINKNAKKLPTYYPEFNSEHYRHLIGINIVREKIRSRWLQAFKRALPALKLKLVHLIANAENEYQNALIDYKRSNPTQVRLSYLAFINEYRRKLALYATYKSEIEMYFPHDRCGTNYEEVENDFILNWPRRKSLKWRAHLTTQEMKQCAEAEDDQDGSLHNVLDCKLVGSSHFDRLQKVFAYMVLTFKHEQLTADEITTIESLLYGGLSCSANTEKLMRDAMHRLLRKTFAVGITWLTQMYSYLLDTFLKAIIEHLLSQNQFNYLTEHVPFLTIVELDYHRRIRTMMRKAIHGVRDTRFAYSAYAHYDLTSWLKKLIFRLPVEIPHHFYSEEIPNVYVKNENRSSRTFGDGEEYRLATIGEIFANINPPQILSAIFGSESYLPSKRDQKSGSYHPSARNTIDELYMATCSRLLYDVSAHFNAHVVIGINNFHHIESYSSQSIEHILASMTDTAIARLASIDLDNVGRRLDYLRDQIVDLTAASVLLEGVTQQLHDDGRNWDSEIQRLERHAQHRAAAVREQLDHRRRALNPFGRIPRPNTSSSSQDEQVDAYYVQADDVEDEDMCVLLNCNGASMCESHLQSIYHRDDQVDLETGLLEGDTLEQDAI
ncbi:unnamed protein product [Rotaria magnacalcarata]|uniref:Dynamin N-terminal domain-containing protein n=2 Tax=Rotaria magnacalcarata TaxID=392030 RepID=A0A816GXM4_9BILA|nr:unnamed protein product [Rotaria magnacalcarata]